MKKNFARKTWCLGVLVVPLLLPAFAQQYTTAGQLFNIVAPALPNNFLVLSNADGSVQKYFGDRYNFWVGKAPGNGTVFDVGLASPSSTNAVVSAQFIQPWNSTNYFWVTVSNSVTGSNSVPSVAATVVVPAPPIVFVLPLQPPSIVTVIPVGSALTK